MGDRYDWVPLGPTISSMSCSEASSKTLTFATLHVAGMPACVLRSLYKEWFLAQCGP